MQMCESVMSQTPGIKGGTADEAFQEQCFLWDRGASVSAGLLHAQETI